MKPRTRLPWSRMALGCVLYGAPIGALAAQEPDRASALDIEVIPGQVYVEKGRSSQLLNFDFIITNQRPQRLSLRAIRVFVYDASEQLSLTKAIDGNGLPPTTVERGDASIEVLHGTEIEGGGTLYVFNPFFAFDQDLDLAELRYEFVFADEQRTQYRVPVTVRPAVYETETDLIIPLAGRVLVRDGHDFYSHHRRASLNHPLAELFGIETNSSRYAYDLSIVDAQGELHRGSGERLEEWYGWGTPVYASGSGTVVAVVDTVSDNPLQNGQVVVPNPMSYTKLDDFTGNNIAIDHGNGEFSVIGHLKHGSVKVHLGDWVEQNQIVAEMGLSGSTSFPHVHYQLQTGVASGTAEGLPSYFRRFRRLLGSRTALVGKGQIDTGDIVESVVTGAR